MRYTLLLTGRNNMVINEFFTYMDLDFECLSTSSRYDDIVNHLKYIQPDALVYCLNGEDSDEMKRFANIENKITSIHVPIVILGSAEECDRFKNVAPTMEITVFKRPISLHVIKEELIHLLDEQKRKRGKELKEEREVEKVLQELKKKHILIVDDDSSVLKLLRGYLAERYNVATAINGKVALKFLETKKTDLILLDYEMPGENGSEVLSKIRANENTKDLPVVFLTGVADRDQIHKVMQMRPQGYLLKPIDMETLSSTIKGILN